MHDHDPSDEQATIDPIERRFAAMDGHKEPVPIYVTVDDIDGDLLFESLAVVELYRFLGTSPAEPHVHACDEIYVLPEQGGEAAEIDVVAGDWRGSLAAPGALRIPAGVPHQLTVRRAAPGQVVLGLFVRTVPSSNTPDGGATAIP